MEASTLNWLKQNINHEDAQGKTILEVGSYNVNGSIRGHIEAHGPKTYVGVDISPGPGVDRVLDAAHLDKLGKRFDVVVSTEMLEHVDDWPTVIRAMKEAVKPGGTLILTTRAPGFPRHCYPHDYWRFTVRNLRSMFSDFDIVKCEPVSKIGVVIKAKRRRQPNVTAAPDLTAIHPRPAPLHDWNQREWRVNEFFWEVRKRLGLLG